jgi:L-asparaginase
MITAMGVVLLTTGGTIATATTDDGIARQASSGRELLASAGHDSLVNNSLVNDALADDVTVQDIMSVDSSAMTPQHWQQLAAAVRGHIARGATGIVIAHGTDTLEETALWLALTCAAPVPVVLTGAQRSADHPEPDGPRNLRDALTVAASGAGLGVVVCFAGQVYPPAGTRKIHLTDLAGFGDSPPLGLVHDGTFTRSVLSEPEARNPFLGTVTHTAPPRVDIVSLYPAADPVPLDAYVAAGARGLVLEAVGAGNANAVVIESITRHLAGKFPVLVTTRVPHGVLTPRYPPGQRLIEAGAIMVPKLRAGQARVLLMAALATGSDLAAAVARLG